MQSACVRCGGLTVAEESLSLEGPLRLARCLMCGDLVDSVVLWNRQHHPEPHRQIHTTTYNPDAWVLRWRARL